MGKVLAFWSLFAIAAIVGWVANIVQICQMSTITTMFIIKVVSIFIAPVGIVLGWIGLF